MNLLIILALKYFASGENIDVTTKCEPKFCEPHQIGDGICDKGCMTEACIYDSLNLNDFSTSDCYKDCIKLGCEESMLHNGQCDEQCNNYQCGWDLGECGYCASGCTIELLQNSDCDEVCSFSQCLFDNNACGYCAKGCFLEDLDSGLCLEQCMFKECYGEDSLCMQTHCSDTCISSLNNDGFCQPECDTPNCRFDFGDCFCPEECISLMANEDFCLEQDDKIIDKCAKFSCDFKKGLCGDCAPGCYESMLGDGKCDSECKNQACGFDIGDCGCSEGCPLKYDPSLKAFEPSDIGCLDECLVEICGYGTSTCSNQAKLKSAVLTSQVFQNFDRVPNLDFCYCESQKIDGMLNGTYFCDRGDDCYVESCLYCFGSNKLIPTNYCLRGNEENCFVCKGSVIKNFCVDKLEKCPLGFISNPELEYLFDEGPKLWCLEDPTYFLYNQPLEIFVNLDMQYEYKDFGNGTIENPINSLHYAFISANAPYTKIYIQSQINYFTYERIFFSPFIDNLASPLESNTDLGQQELWIVGMAEYGVAPIIYLKYNFVFKPRFAKTFIANVTISGRHFFSQCYFEFCQYCRSISLITGTINDDKGNVIDPYDYYTINVFCSIYHSTNVFTFYNEAVFQDVTFSEMRYQFNSLIKSNSSLILNNVKFYKVQAGPLGSIILQENPTSSPRSSLVYTNGEVSDLGAGYESVRDVTTGNFIKLINTNSLLIQNVEFNFNFIFSSIQTANFNYLIYIKNLRGQMKFFNLSFANNYVNYLIYVDQENLIYDDQTELSDDSASKYSMLHFQLKDVKFTNNYCSVGLFYYLMAQTLQNIQISSIDISGSVSGKEGIFSIKNSKTLESTEINGGFSYIGSSRSSTTYWIEKRIIDLSNITIKDSHSGGTVVNLEKLPNIKLENFILSNIHDGSKSSILELTALYAITERYLTTIDDEEVPDMDCTEIFKISSSVNILLDKLTFSENSCLVNQGPSGMVLSEISGLTNLSNINFLNINSQSSKGLLLAIDEVEKISIFNLQMNETSNELGSLVAINSVEELYISNLSGYDLSSKYAGVFIIFESRIVELKDFIFHNSTAYYAEGGCISLKSLNEEMSALVMNGLLHSCKSFNNKGGGLFIDSLNIETRMILQILNLNFFNCSANDGALVYISSMVGLLETNDSTISSISASISTSDQGGNIALYFAKGNLILSNITMRYNYGVSAGIIAHFLEGNSSFSVFNIKIIDSESENIFSLRSTKNMNSVLMTDIQVESAKATVFDLIFVNLVCLRLDIQESLTGLIADMNSTVSFIEANLENMNGGLASLSQESKFYCERCVIRNNSQKVVSATGFSSVRMKDSVVEGNSFDEDEGFLLSQGIHFMDNVKFRLNRSPVFGIFSLVDLRISFNDCTFVDNEINNMDYIALVAADSFIIINRTSFTQSTNIKGSYLMFTINNKVEFSECEFISSSADSPILFINQGSLSIFSSTFNDFASQVIRSIDSDVKIYSSKFESSKIDTGTINEIFHIESGSFLADSITISDLEFYYQADESNLFYLSKVLDVYIINSKFYGPGSNLVALFIEDCSNILISGSEFYNFLSYSHSPITLKSYTEFSQCVLIDCIVSNNTSFSQGGGINSEDVELMIVDSNFTFNYAFAKGGAISFQSPNCDLCLFNITGTSFIEYNECDGRGGGVYWDDFKPNVSDSVIFMENSAKYGDDIASRPAMISSFLMQGAIQALKKYIMFVDNIPPGQTIDRTIYLSIKDTYGKVVSDENSTISLSAQSVDDIDSNLVSISGMTEYQGNDGVFEINDTSVFGYPGSSVEIVVYSKAIEDKSAKNDETVYSSTAYILINLRECVPGEIPYENRCIPCPEDQFSITNSTKCKDCPTGAECPGRNKLIVKKGYWRSCIESDVVENCIPREACLAGNSSYELGECQVGYTGVFCQSCEHGYSKTVSSVCSKCPDDSNNKVTAVILISILISICVIMVKTTLKSAFTLKSLHSIYIKILINYIQLIFITTQINILWPTYLDSAVLLQRSAATLSERIFSFDCYLGAGSTISAYYSKIVIFAIAPVIISMISSVIWIGYGFYMETNLYAKRENMASIIVLYFLIYPNILRIMFSHFLCRYADKIGTFLYDNTLVVCWEGQHLSYLKIVVVPSIVVWGFFVPGVLMVLMIKLRKKLHLDKYKIIFGYLSNGYKRNAFYWEFVILYRKIILISISVFLSLESTIVQALTMIISLIISIYFQYSKNPYCRNELNQIEIKSLLIATVTIYSSLYFLPESIPQGYIIIVSALIVLGNSYFFISWIYFMSKAVIEMAIKIFPSFKYALKKGDAFEQDFNQEKIVRKGIFLDRDGFKVYSFMNNIEDQDCDKVEFENVNQLFDDVCRREKYDLD